MTSRIYANIGVGLLVVCLALSGCRKKAAEGVDEDYASRSPGEKVILEDGLTVSQSADVNPVTSDTGTLIAPPPAAASNTPTTRPAVKAPQVVLETARGDIVVELDPTAAPVTVANFLRYVREGFYDGTIFHRVLAGAIIQGGGYTASMVPKDTHSPINNEASNGLKNVRGTIAMARTPLPDSATSQFYINLRDNSMLDYGTCPDGYGYTVFGKVIKGMDVADALGAAPAVVRDGEQSFPVQPVVIKKASIVQK
ncbi:MAG TPA: peptidylprolyl isomerase [Anaerohalosphaeraceae bacterium]|jgi:peptidyl-prolyl cis-trans isomerase A (cyclophilin A)|nr:peptidylprolyl isomerase [Anaerohalosphaeraceae bacterium]HRT50410.1 peptidylprolyl isomerase [Anaerohalosphaeraceae bacterium]HRT86340.1 peptidylprolyl isomerase [Anaerohalosphaeraceae bacterium]